MSFDFSQINYWAVLVAAVASFMVGGVWYGALFAKKRPEVMGFSAQEIQEMAKKQPRNFGIFFVGDLVMATVLSLFAINLEIQSAGAGIAVGFLLWLGVAAVFGASKKAAENRPLVAFAIDTSHELACLAALGAIIGAWQ